MGINQWDRGASAAAFEELAELWNVNADGRHSFHPWTGSRLYALLAGSRRFRPEQLLTVRRNGRLAGFLHYSFINEPGCRPVASIEALLVDRECRGLGLANLLMQAAVGAISQRGVEFIDAMGAWPYGHLYTTLADGSERSGVFHSENDLAGLFAKFGFNPEKASLVMRGDLAGHAYSGKTRRIRLERRICKSWFDFVFRGRELWDHDLLDDDGHILSRAVFGRMDGESLHTGMETYSLFGVNTPPALRRQGFASENLNLLMSRLAGNGVRRVELHVYAGNEPALMLYRRLGFVPVAETMMMRLASPGAGRRGGSTAVFLAG